MIIRVGHLYPEYLNIYADRGNIAVFERRAAARGHELARRRPSRSATPLDPAAHDLALRRRRPGSRAGDDRARPRRPRGGAARGGRRRGRRCSPSAAATSCSAAATAAATDRGSPGAALFPHETVAGETRMIGDVLLESTLAEAPGGRSRASRTMPAARSSTRAPCRSAASSPATGTTARRASRAVASGRAIGTYLHGPLLPRNPWLADLLLSWALAHATGGEPEPLAAARRTSSSTRRTRSRPPGRGHAADGRPGRLHRLRANRMTPYRSTPPSGRRGRRTGRRAASGGGSVRSAGAAITPSSSSGSNSR